MKLLSIRDKKGNPSRPELTRSCLSSAEPSITKHKENVSGMRAVHVYEPLSNSVSEVKQPRICMLRMLIYSFRPATGYEYREQVLSTLSQLCTYIYPLCFPFPRFRHRGPPGLILATILVPTKQRERERERIFIPIQ